MTVPPQGGWRPGPSAGPSQPPPTVDGLKWLLVAIAVLLVVTISVGATLIVTRWGKGAATKAAFSDSTSDIASANDIGPVSIITDEPTCAALTALNNGLASAQANGWADQRANLGPASTWTPNQRTQVETVAKAMRRAANLAVPLAKQTPHRLIRELYEQFIAYSRAYASSVVDYMPADNAYATASVSASSALVGICNSISTGSTSRGLSVNPVPAPSNVATVFDPANPERFVTSSNSTCTDWVARLDKFNMQSASSWQNRDSSVPGSQWTADRQAVEKAAEPLLIAYAADSDKAGAQSNSGFQDFAYATATYIRAYLSAGFSYTSADGWLNYAAFQIANFVSAACTAVAA